MERSPRARLDPAPEEVAAACLAALPFALYLLVVQVVAPPTPAEWASADPILTLVPR